MDTRWKKWKKIISVASCLLGLYLLFLGLFSGGIGVVEEFLYDESISGIQEDLEADYQNTGEFRQFVSGKLEELLSIAAGRDLGEYYGISYYEGTVVEEGYYSDWYDWGWNSGGWFDFGSKDTAVATEEPVGILEEAADEASYWGEVSEPSQEEITKDERLHAYLERMARDKNVLYQVLVNGEELCANTEGLELDGTTGKMPEGYNFLLYFDGEKVKLYKDGKELPVYDSDYYEPGSGQWYVPGYRNFYVDEFVKDARVTMAIAKQPRLYVQGNYADNGTEQYGSRLYWMERSHMQYREALLKNCGRFFLGILLLAVSWVFRKEKKTADQKLAFWTGKLWIEIKVLAGLGVPLLFFNQAYRIYYWGYEEGGRLRLLLAAALAILYLFVNDLWKNRKRQKGILKKLWQWTKEAVRTKALTLEVQKRMVFRLRAAVIFALLGMLCLLLAFWMNEEGYYWMEVPFYVVLGMGCLLLLLGLVLFVFHALSNKRDAEDIGALGQQIEAVREGNLTDGLSIPASHDLHEMAEHLNDIQRGMHRAMEEQMKSERMKVELISNVSHDIKTPLTSIISYVELLKEEEELPDHVKDYIQILGQKSERLKTMVQDVFEVSKASSGQLPVRTETLDLLRLICQTLADMDEQIRASGMALKTDLPAGEVLIRADGQRLYRVFQNLLQNALKYSLSGSRIHVTLRTKEGKAVASIQNVSCMELDAGVDFTERFVRGDASRTDGGSGLGLSIAKSFTEACGGSFEIRINADLFTAEVVFLLAESEQK